MRRLGFDRFAVVGHDRGSYTAFRTAMDHPEAVTRLAVLDGVPIPEALERCDARSASAWWHRFFFAQPDEPERAVLADPEAWYRPSAPAADDPGCADFRAAIHDPATVHGMVEDCRAGLGIDRRDDEADRAAGRASDPGALVAAGRLRAATAACPPFGAAGPRPARDAASTAGITWPKKRPLRNCRGS